ncbi:unnamed protein product [Caenorhabditis brenneri]
MANIHKSLAKIITILCILVTFTDAHGTIELIISSPKTVLVEPTVCANLMCPAPDGLAEPREVQAGTALRFGTGHYRGEARERIDFHLKVLQPFTNEIIAIEHFRPSVDNEWSPLVLITSRGFNVTIQLRNKCDTSFYGKRCGRFCISSRDHRNHWECSSEGERRCAAGYTGADCSTPTCFGGCNGRGRCISPNKCSCFDGFNGTQCEQCIPRPGCLHGGCLNGMPNTCKCKDGFIGEKCDTDVDICSAQKPCANGGRCSIDPSSGSGFKCECPFNFLGARCEIPLSSHVCKNGGVFSSMDEKTFQCKCPKGFTGKFCELRINKNCSTMKCSKTSECHMVEGMPMCLEKEVTKMSKNEEIKEDNEKISTKRMEMGKAVGDLETNSSLITLGLFCIIGLMLSMFLIYTRFINKSHRSIPSHTASSLPKTTTSSTSSPVHKICIIDAENGHPSNSSDSEPDLCLHRHSPPPPYSSPAPFPSVQKHTDRRG